MFPIEGNTRAVIVRGAGVPQITESQPSQSPNFTYVPLAPAYQPPVVRGAREMSREQGRALETLAHAIEYLQDEFVLGCVMHGQDAYRNSELEAIDTLKAVSRTLWFSLPAREPAWRRWLHRSGHAPVITLPM